MTSLLDDPAKARRLGAQGHRDVGGAAIGEHVEVLDDIVVASRRAGRRDTGLTGRGIMAGVDGGPVRSS